MKQLWPAPNIPTKESIIHALEGQEGVTMVGRTAFFRPQCFMVKLKESDSLSWQPMAVVADYNELILLFMDGTRMAYPYARVESISVK